MKKAYIMMAAVIIIASAAGAAAANFGRGFFKPGFNEEGPKGHQTMMEQKAEVLGLSIEELQAKLDEGETIQDIFEEQGVTKEDFMIKRQEDMEERLNSLVEEGKITQEEADEKLQKMEEMRQKMEEKMENYMKNCPEECRDCMMGEMGMIGWPKMGRGMGMMKPPVEE